MQLSFEAKDAVDEVVIIRSRAKSVLILGVTSVAGWTLLRRRGLGLAVLSPRAPPDGSVR